MAEHSRLPCNQCLFFTSAGCKRGDACAFCHHLVAPQAAPSRPRKHKRDAMRQRIWSLLEQLDVEKQEPQEIVYQLQIEIQGTYFRRVAQGAVDSLVEVEPKQVTQGSCGALDCFSV
ncbi:unnamed protein product [Cladocopium goreaui]|uniref:C3H1-type domain-containing protein n=1 Tax=Cladocopium goreaui TaxID=2562237 RepID=A0A9P1G0C1_9DINO|nr:unnamed protein product [Cladocopium goreaui]